MNVNSKRTHILLAASTIVKNNGVEKLTLEAVAKEAGISKGGLLYHFPNKQALIDGMVEESTNHFFANINERATKSTTRNGQWSRAYLEATSDDIKDGVDMNSALIASLFTTPDLLAKWKNEYIKFQDKIEHDGIDPVISNIVRLAADGLWLSEIFGIGTLYDELHEEVIQHLINMTKQGG